MSDETGRSTRRGDEASGGHDDPAAIRLLADRIDTTQPGDDVALVDLDDAHAALDQGGAAPDIAHHPAIEPACAWSRRGRNCRRRGGGRRRDRAGDIARL